MRLDRRTIPLVAGRLSGGVQRRGLAHNGAERQALSSVAMAVLGASSGLRTTYRVCMIQRGSHCRGSFGDVGSLRAAGAARRGARPWVWAQDRLRAADRWVMGAQHRSGLHDAPAAGARRVRRGRAVGQRAPRLPDHRHRSRAARDLVRDARHPRGAAARRVDDQGPARGRGRRRGPDRGAAAAAVGLGGAAPGLHAAEGAGGSGAGCPVPDHARCPDLPDGGRDPLARRLRGTRQASVVEGKEGAR